MHEAPQHDVPARSIPTEHSVYFNVLAAQPTLSVLSTGVGAVRAAGLSRLARINALCARYERIPGFWLMADPAARYRRLRAAYRAELFAPITSGEQYGPTTTDGESHLTDEDVLAAVAESQERAHAQLFGGAK